MGLLSVKWCGWPTVPLSFHQFLTLIAWVVIFFLLLLLSLILLDSSIMFTISAGSNPGSGALMGSHGLHSIDRSFRRMWLDPRRAIF